MSTRLDELLRAYFYDDLSEEESAELDAIVASNDSAAAKLEMVKEDKAKFRDAPIPEPPKTRLRTRVLAAFLLLIILSGFIGMFWVRIEDDLIRDVHGKVLVDGQPVTVVFEPATVEFPGEARFAIRGQSEASTTGAKLKVAEREPFAEITLLEGDLSVKRTRQEKGGAIFLLGGCKVELLERLSEASFTLVAGKTRISLTTGKLSIVNESPSKALLRLWDSMLTLEPESSIELHRDKDDIHFVVEREGVSLQAESGLLNLSKGTHQLNLVGNALSVESQATSK
ncbi:MAG: hypothetical protein KDB07_09715 [Planctomycetes bacterium]|nr:hypothetical protein [Planctomycetota bacterium]